MINKGRIHGELGKFERHLWNSIKSDDELRLEIGKFMILINITQLQIHGIKNQVILIRIRGVIEVRKWDRNSIEIKTKLNLIYDSKYKINNKWRKIKMKTRNLTQSSPRNDPINLRIHNFSFCDFEDEHWHSRCDFSFSCWSIFNFKCSSDAETSQERK